jgi:hypothetical protein
VGVLILAVLLNILLKQELRRSTCFSRSRRLSQAVSGNSTELSVRPKIPYGKLALSSDVCLQSFKTGYGYHTEWATVWKSVAGFLFYFGLV